MPHNLKLVDGVPSKQHPMYSLWKGMRERCRYTKHRDYNLYGGRGIKVCPRWDSFENFAEDMGPRPEGKTLDRIDGDGDYSPENCKWSTPKEQVANQRKRKCGFSKGVYKNSATGVKGVHPLPNGKFRASVCRNKKTQFLGCFDTVEQAAAARKNFLDMRQRQDAGRATRCPQAEKSS